MYTYVFSDGVSKVFAINVDFEGDPMNEVMYMLEDYEHSQDFEDISDPNKILIYPSDGSDNIKSKAPYVINLNNPVSNVIREFDWRSFFEENEVENVVSKIESKYLYH